MIKRLLVALVPKHSTWDKLVIIAEQCPPFPKPVLVKLASEQLLEVLGLNA
jgi:hypothetical protein